MTIVLLAAVAGVLLVSAFAALERRGQPEVAVAVVFGAVLLEALLFATQHVVPTGLFRIPAGFSLRLPMLLVPAALLGRGLVRGLPRRVTTTGLVWVGFFAWYATAAVLGVLAGHARDQVLLEAFTIVYLGGAIALAAGVSPRRLLDRSFLRRAVLATGAFAAVLVPMSLSSTEVTLPLGVATVPRFGSWGADTTSIVAALAAVALLCEVVARRRRHWFMMVCLLLLVSPIAGTQRASLVVALVIAGGLSICALAPTGRRRIRTTPTEAAIGFLVLASVGLVFALPQLGRDGSRVEAVVDNAGTVWFGETASRSTAARVQLWSGVQDQIAERPLIGWGLGKQTLLRRPLPFEPTELSAHNIYLDLLLRGGFVGLALFAVAVGCTARAAVRVWQLHADAQVAALALGCALALAGLLAKGAFESILEEFRLVTVMGLAIGLVLAATPATSRDGAPAPAGRRAVGVR